MRGIAVGFALALVVGAAPSASAQRAVSAELDGVTDGQVVEGTIPLTAQASSAAGIRRLTMWIDGDVVAEVAPNNLRQEVETSFEWDTNYYVSSDQIARNRSYTLKVKAVSNSGGEDEVTHSVIVDNSPNAPLGLTSRVDDNTITLTWAASPEPDITGYRVEHFYGDEYVKTAVVDGTEYSTRKDPGKYAYRIVALRHSDVNADDLESDPSTSVTAAVAASAGSTLERTSGRSKGDSSRSGGSRAGVRIGAGGLPSSASLPNVPGMSGLPDAPPAIPWGSYEKRLPYKLPKGGIPIEASAARAARASWTVIPPDGLRWVALGLLLMVTAAASRFTAWKLQVAPEPAKIDA